jgi:hypothetical protein
VHLLMRSERRSIVFVGPTPEFTVGNVGSVPVHTVTMSESDDLVPCL